MTMTDIWIKLFGSTEFHGLNMGFWVSMIVVAVIVILMNAVFWGMKPKDKYNKAETEKTNKYLLFCFLSCATISMAIESFR